jgi:phosphoribosylformylglycinamidine synthase
MYQNRVEITETLLADHRISPSEYQEIERHLGRPPTFTELGVFSVMWSEHCSYKSSRVHLKKFPTTGPRVIQGPGENAGVVDIGDGLAAVFKMESHNHPSFIEPYQGAATGVGGILRDIFTMGARPVASLNSLRFGAPDHPKTPFLVSGVVAGIAGYGNAIGVPTVGGEVYFDPSYNGNILVNVFNLGVVHRDRIFLGRAAGPGNLVIYVGSGTGRDGIHGATMASGTFEEDSEARRPTVQVGDPFTEKRLLEACLELFHAGCLVGIQDMGAAGLTSSSVEMAGRAGTGLELDLDRIPMREVGMTPYEILLSESQERMLVVVEPGQEVQLKAIFDKWDLEATVVGQVTGNGRWIARWHGEVVADIPVAVLTDAAPVYRRPYEPPADLAARQALPEVPLPASAGEVLRKLLASPSIASKRWISEQYDSMVRTDTVVGFGGDAAVIRVKGTDRALALTVDCNSSYCQLDPRRGAELAVAESARNLACVGAVPIGLTDCLNFGNPERPDIMWQFVEAVEGLANACRELEIPVVSGNVSLYNETEGRAIQPTPTVGLVGLLDDARKVCTAPFKGEGHVIALLGEPGDEVGGSEYLREIHGIRTGRPAAVEWARERAVNDACRTLVREGLLKSAHDCSEGGIAVALAESCVGASSPVGAYIDGLAASSDGPPQGAARWDRLLFGESSGRILISLEPKHLAAVKAVAERCGAPFTKLGVTGGDRLAIAGLLNEPVVELAGIYEGALVERVFQRP